MTFRRPHSATVLDILRMAGELEWARIGIGAEGATPGAPLLVWRYVAEPSWFAHTISSAVAGYDGKLRWVIEKPGRNWVLWPEREKLEFETGNWGTDSLYLAHLTATDPEFCVCALDDLAGLLDHIEKEFESGDH